MKKLVFAVSVVFFAAGVSLAAQTGNVPTSELPEVKEVIGDQDVTLEATYYPNITATDLSWEGSLSDDCYSFIDKVNMKKTKIGEISIASGLPGLKEDSGGSPINKSNMGLRPIPDLQTTVSILPSHKKTAKILVFWTVRVIGRCPTWRLDERVCQTFEATANFTCSGNDVITYVKVNDNLKSNNKCTLQIPEMKSGADEDEMYDPTISGTYVITKDDFQAKEFPEKVTIQIYWENKSAMRIATPAKMHNLIVNVIPYSKTDK